MNSTTDGRRRPNTVADLKAVLDEYDDDTQVRINAGGHVVVALETYDEDDDTLFL